MHLKSVVRLFVDWNACGTVNLRNLVMTVPAVEFGFSEWWIFFFYLCKGMWLAGIGYTKLNYETSLPGLWFFPPWETCSVEKCGVKQFAREIAVLAAKCW